MNNTVSVKNLSHSYGKIRALDDVSLDIPSGATVGLIGPDGVGKSTLLSLIAGVRVIQNGTVNVLGGDMADADTRLELSHRIAYMPQGLGKNLYPTLSVYENIEFHARLFGLTATERKQRIQRLLDATRLAPFHDRAAGKLSGGMKQKLSLCCALVHNPDLLILDEPTTGVDPLSRRQFWALVNELRQEIKGMTVIVATAYIDEAEQFEHLLAMDAGKLLANKPTRQVMQELDVGTLEEAYIKLLPEEKQQGAGGVELTPFEPEPNAPPAMEAHGLTKKFGDFVAVDHVSFKIEKGEIFGFLGSNGCGKSTTMKMLTGLLEPTSGEAELLGRPIDAGSISIKKRVGYMSQAFSLYEELTVRQNLSLHAKLYEIADRKAAVEQGLRDFDLADVGDTKPADLPLGIRQRLQLAAACLHQPEVLILDEPTSGVDPAARDMFWRKLLQLSRDERITIFVSTHFMNEVERCDRISLMNRGKVLAVGTPAEVVAQSGEANMEEAFIHYLLLEEEHEVSDSVNDTQPENVPSESSQENFSGSLKKVSSENADLNDTVDGTTAPTTIALPSEQEKGQVVEYSDGFRQPEKNIGLEAQPASMPSEGLDNFRQPENTVHVNTEAVADNHNHHTLSYWFAMVYTFAMREAKELLRDKIRLFFAALGPAILLAALGWAISFDVSGLKFSVLDRDQSVQSRALVAHFAGSAYFKQQPSLPSDSAGEILLKSDKTALVIDIPPDFGKNLILGRQPEVGFHIDGTAPFNGSNVAAYILGMMGGYNTQVLKSQGIELPQSAEIVPRFMYNQDVKSVNSMVPGVIMLVLMMIPTVMSALAVVREREIGSIQNLYASPASVTQYLLGKQLPYIVMGVFNFLLLSAMTVFWFNVPMKGSFWATMLGAMLLVCCSTGLGLLISSFTKSQTAAFFISSLGSMVPTIDFSGLMYPVATLEGGAYVMGLGFPASWFGTISRGGFTKGLGFVDFLPQYAMLVLFYVVYFSLATRLLKKQEK